MALVDEDYASLLLNLANDLFFWINQIRVVAKIRPCFLSKKALRIRIDEIESRLAQLKKLEAEMPDDPS